MKHLIIGGVAGGATAAARIRRMDEFAEIVLLEKGKYISYASCGLPYYIGGMIPNREHLLVQTPQAFSRRFKIDVRVGHEAMAIDPVQQIVTVREPDGELIKETYDRLLLSPGAVPIRPKLPGVDLDGVFTLRNVEDMDRIRAYMDTHAPKRALIVGGGFIGLEMAENLHQAGMSVAVVEMKDQVLAPLDFSMASLVHQHLLQKNVQLYLNQALEQIVSKETALTAVLRSRETMDTDLVILSLGVRPETALAHDAGLAIGETGGIWVNEYLETSVKGIYAVGDAIEYPHPLTGKPWLNLLAGPANRQARIVADNMVLGNTVTYEGSIGTAIAKVFDLAVASTGLSAKQLRQMSIPYQSSITHSSSHAGYYPGALPISIKLTFDSPSEKLYGAQCVGFAGVDKRMDELALLIKKGGTIRDLTQLEHAYAPPFSSAKDPIAIAGYVAENILADHMPVATWRDMLTLDHEHNIILDVRSAKEYALEAIPHAINIPLDALRERMSELPRDKPIYVYCAVGVRGYLALKILAAHGYAQVKNLSGGYKTYMAATAPVPSVSSALK